MEQMIKYLENKIEDCDILGGLQKEKWAFTQCLKEAKRQALISPVVLRESEQLICDVNDKKTICENPLSHECCNKHHKRI